MEDKKGNVSNIRKEKKTRIRRVIGIRVITKEGISRKEKE